MLGRMRMAGEADGVATPLEQREERVPVLQILIGLVVEKGADGNVHHNDDERVVRRVREHVAHELELALVKPALVLASSPNLVRVVPKIVDVIKHEEERLPVIERVIVRAEDALEGLATIFAVRRFEIEIVVAADVPPRKADRAHDRVRARIEREIVEHDVAGGEAELGVGAGQGLDQVLANEVDFRAGLRLRIGHHDDVERLRLVLTAQREIDRRRQRPGRRQALEGETEIGRRALRLMVAIEARQISERLDWGHEARGLDDEERRLLRQRERIAAVMAGDSDVAAVGDEHAGKPWIGGAGGARAVSILEHDAGNLRPRRRLRLGPPRLDRRQRKPARRADQHLAPCESIAMMFGHSSISDSPLRRKWPGHDALMKQMGH